jgi:hypothetical protein
MSLNSLSLNSNSNANLETLTVESPQSSLSLNPAMSNGLINHSNLSNPAGLANPTEFNQYQLELNGELNEMGGITQNSNGLVHSSSTNSLSQPLMHQLTTSKTVHSFNNLVDKKAPEDAGAKAVVSATKLLKQSPDNVSEREVNPTNSALISIGCQTISTGDITLTNVYIE